MTYDSLNCRRSVTLNALEKLFVCVVFDVDVIQVMISVQISHLENFIRCTLEDILLNLVTHPDLTIIITKIVYKEL